MSLITSIGLSDGFTPIMHRVIDTVNMSINAMQSLHRSVSQPIDASTYNDIVNSANNATNSFRRTSDSIDNNSGNQHEFNKKLKDGQKEASKLTSMIKRAVGAYATIQSVKMVLNISDTLTSTTARLNLMNDGLQTTNELQQMIYKSAERSRGSYQATADAVSKLGLMAGDAFSSSAEIIAFTEQLNKQFTIAGTEASGVEAAMLQLTQAMGSGVLRGEEYNSILEQAPNIIQSIADYMDVPKGKLKDLAGEGKITADIVKNAMFAAAEETNAKFESMPKTFGQIFTSIKNTALMKFQPILSKLTEISNSDEFNNMIQGIINGLSTLSSIALNAFNIVLSIGTFVRENWAILSPIIYGIVTALGIYTAAIIANNIAQGVGATIRGIVAVKESVLAAYRAISTGATIAQTVAQHGLNAALLACPITWIVLGIIAFIAVIFAAASAIAKFTGITSSGFSLICGVINVVIQFFFNLLKVVGNVALGIGGIIAALGHNIMTAFLNSITNVQSWFYDLLSTALKVVAGIAEALNKLPFVEFDYSGITSKANEYANKSAALQDTKGEYKNIIEEFNKGFNTFDAFWDGWVSDAFNSGAEWGDSLGNKISDIFNPDFDINQNNNVPDLGGIQNSLDDISGGVRDTAGSTGSIKDSLDISNEDIKYLRDIAERETINRFTTAEIKVDMGGVTNNVSSDMDLNGIIDKLTSGVQQAMEIAAEGVHI